MKIGIPKGLLYYKYHPFFMTFFTELGAETIVSEDTNKSILDLGVKHCVDEACMPVKVFHGHVASLRDKCDAILIPRIMQIRKREYICPKFCGLPEMVVYNIPDLPAVISEPIYATDDKRLYEWAKEAGRLVTRDRNTIRRAFEKAVSVQNEYDIGINTLSYEMKVALAGHPYNIYDSYSNMNIVRKLNALGIGIITEEFVDEEEVDSEVGKLFKRPFWTFARNTYGFLATAYEKKLCDGVIYISSFACGIDSVLIELVKERIGDFPFMVLKIDEHTGESGVNTRIEAFVDMLERRKTYEDNVPSYGQCVPCSQGSF